MPDNNPWFNPGRLARLKVSLEIDQAAKESPEALENVIQHRRESYGMSKVDLIMSRREHSLQGFFARQAMRLSHGAIYVLAQTDGDEQLVPQSHADETGLTYTR